jgi:hypothetical protein
MLRLQHPGFGAYGLELTHALQDFRLNSRPCLDFGLKEPEMVLVQPDLPSRTFPRGPRPKA